MTKSYSGTINDLLFIDVQTNPGVAFSNLSDVPGWTVDFLQIFIAIVLLSIVAFLKPTKLSKWYVLLLCVIAFGGIFNTIDRNCDRIITYTDRTVYKQHEVLDYFCFGSFLKGFGAIFNMADSLIVTSSCALGLVLILEICLTFKNNTETQNIKQNLFIDTTQKKLNLALFQDKKIYKTFSIATHNNLTDIAMEHLDRFLKSNGVIKKNIENIYLTVGPGSFTGVRVGCLLTKGWYTKYKVNIYTIDTITLQAATNCVSAVDAQGGKVYYAIVRDGKSDKIDMCSNDELVHFAKKHHLEVASDYQHVDIFKNLLTHLNNFKKTSIEELTPVYIKPPVS